MLLRLIIEMLVLMIKNTGIACIAMPIQVSVFMTTPPINLYIQS